MTSPLEGAGSMPKKTHSDQSPHQNWENYH